MPVIERTCQTCKGRCWIGRMYGVPCPDCQGDERQCIVCGQPVKCEPGYPQNVRVVCWPCIRGSANAR